MAWDGEKMASDFTNVSFKLLSILNSYTLTNNAMFGA
jgi:hypothetical protein